MIDLSICKNCNFAEPDWDSMRPVYAKVINEYLASMNLVSGCKFDFGIVNYSAYGDTMSNMRSHFHTESDFSAVHYIQFDERVHTPTRFENPFKWGDYQNVMRPHLEKCVVNNLSNSWTCDWWELETHEDDIVFLYLSREELNAIKNYIPKDESLQKLPIYKIITDDEFFATSGIPTTFIINSDGKVIVKDLGSAFWNDESVFKFIDNLIGKNEI